MARSPHDAARDDAALLLGDAAAFGAFYRRHEDALLAYFLRRTGQPSSPPTSRPSRSRRR